MQMKTGVIIITSKNRFIQNEKLEFWRFIGYIKKLTRYEEILEPNEKSDKDII